MKQILHFERGPNLISHPVICPSFLVGCAFLILSPENAIAGEKRGEIFCQPTKKAIKIVDELSEVEERYRDVVDVDIDPRFLIKDGGVWPERFYLSEAGRSVKDLPFSKEDGRIEGFMDSARAYPETEICVDDPTRADRPADDEGLYFEMGLSPFFHNRTGHYSMEELKEGTKDGKNFYKKMIPNALTMFMPDTDYLAVKYEDKATPFRAYVILDGVETLMKGEKVKDFYVISFKNMEDWGAEGLVVKGGAYNLQPVPSPSVMRRFGWGKETES